MADPTPDPVAPDPTQPLSESLGLPAGLAQSQTATPQLAPQGYQGPRPILMDLIQGLIKPKMQAQPGQMARPVSRAATFEDFLGNFVGALGQGFAASGHGPGAAARGAGAAIGAPLQMQQQQQQFATEQAQRQAQTQMTQEQAAALPAQRQAQIAALTSQPRFDPQTHAYLGAMNDAQFQNYLKGQGAAGVNAQSRLTIAQLNANVKAGQVARVEDYRDPNTGQITGRMAYGKDGRQLGLLEGAVDPKTLATTTTSQQWIETSPGVWNLVDKTSNTRKGGTPAPTAGAPIAGGSPVIGGPANFPQPQNPVVGGPARFPQAQPAQTNRIPQPPTAQQPAGAPVSGGVQRQGRTLYGAKPVVAFNPGSGEREITTPAQAAQWGTGNQALAIKDGDVEKWSAATRQFNDVQLNTSRYTAAARDYQAANLPAATRVDDQARLHDLLNKAGIADIDAAVAGGGHVKVPIITALSEALSRESKSSAYAGLSAQGKALYDGYMRTLASVPAYQKALTGIGRFNKEVVEMELANIPNPTMALPDISRKLGQWQENIDRGYEGTPRIKGIDTPKDVRNKIEGRNVGFQIPQPLSR